MNDDEHDAQGSGHTNSSMALSKHRGDLQMNDMPLDLSQSISQAKTDDTLGGNDQGASQATNSLAVEIELPPASLLSSMSVTSKVMRSYDQDGDGKFSRDEVHAMAADLIKEKKTRGLATKAAIAMGVLILLVVGLNAGLTAAIVFLSKDVKVVGGVLVDPSTNERLKVSSADTTVASDGSLRDQKAKSVSVSTHTQKNVYAVILIHSQRRLDEQGSGGGNKMLVAQVTCENVLSAIASIEHGDDTGLVRIDFGNGDISLPSLSAANYHMRNDSFGMEQISLSDNPDVSYDVSCETTKPACETSPGDLCDVVLSAATSSTRRALSFEESFDGDFDVGASNRRRLQSDSKDALFSMLLQLARTFTTKASLQTAVQAYNTNPTAAIATYGPIADWDVSAITDMSYLFYELKNFNADISNWDTSSVTTMEGMFFYASAFNQPLSFDTSKVTNMYVMFYYASAFNQPLSFDTSKVTNMAAMFYGTAFNQPLSFDTSKVTNMYRMFYRASAFNQPLSFDTSKVTNMWSMFEDAHKFNQPLSFDMSSVTDKRYMFTGSGCSFTCII